VLYVLYCMGCVRKIRHFDNVSEKNAIKQLLSKIIKLNFLEMFIRMFILRFLYQIAAIVHHGLILCEVPPADLCHEIKIHFWI
jgi:hypothetical protein